MVINNRLHLSALLGILAVVLVATLSMTTLDWAQSPSSSMNLTMGSIVHAELSPSFVTTQNEISTQFYKEKSTAPAEDLPDQF